MQRVLQCSTCAWGGDRLRPAVWRGAFWGGLSALSAHAASGNEAAGTPAEKLGMELLEAKTCGLNPPPMPLYALYFLRSSCHSLSSTPRSQRCCCSYHVRPGPGLAWLAGGLGHDAADPYVTPEHCFQRCCKDGEMCKSQEFEHCIEKKREGAPRQQHHLLRSCLHSGEVVPRSATAPLHQGRQKW